MDWWIFRINNYLFIILLFMLIIITSIGICNSFWVVWPIEYCWEWHYFIVGMILLEKSCSPLSVWQLNQELQDTVRASISCFIILSETRVVFMIFHIDKTMFWISIETPYPFLVECAVAFKPFLKSHSAHDIVIGHRIETIEGLFDFLLGTKTNLKWVSHPCFGHAIEIHKLIILEAPRLIS